MGIPGRLACPRCHEGGDLTAPPEVCGSCGTVMEIEPDLRLVKPNLAEKIRRRPGPGGTGAGGDGGLGGPAGAVKGAAQAFGRVFCPVPQPRADEGKKSYAFETWEDLRGETPDWMLHPIGGGLGVTACWKGWRELVALGWARGVPRMVAAQPAAADPITRAFEAGRDEVAPVTAAPTVAQAIAVGAPPLGWRCLDAVRRTGGGGATRPPPPLPAAPAPLPPPPRRCS